MHTAESLQSCPTLCNPMHCGLPDSSVHEISQVRILEWVACPPPGDLPDPEIKHMSLYISYIISSVQFSRSVVSDSLRPNELQHTRPPCPTPAPGAYPNSCPSKNLILCHPLLLLPSIFPSIRVFSNESAVWIRWPKYWSFSFSISPSNEHPGLISFSMDWLDLLAVQGTLKSLLQHHSSKALVLWHSAFFIVQLS